MHGTKKKHKEFSLSIHRQIAWGRQSRDSKWRLLSVKPFSLNFATLLSIDFYSVQYNRHTFYSVQYNRHTFYSVQYNRHTFYSVQYNRHTF